MKQQLARISVLQSAKIVAILYAILGLAMIPLFWLVSLADPEGAAPLWLLVLFPLFYAIMGYVFTALCAVVYNAIASRAGGIEFTLRAAADPNPGP
jgi:apolipoprotein N-acyltransferase